MVVQRCQDIVKFLHPITPVFLLGFLLCPHIASGQCTTYENSLRRASRFQVWADLDATIYQNGFLFATNWENGPGSGYSQFTVINISNPSAPTIESVLDFPRPAYLIAILGSLAYVSREDSTLIVMDISDPADPFIVNTVQVPGSLGGMVVAGSVAFTVNAHGFLSFDISNPIEPTLIGSIALPSYPGVVALSGTLAYVTNYDQGLQVIDVASPASPQIIGNVITQGYARSILIQGEYAYVQNDTGIQIFNISTPGQETLVSAIPVYLRTFNWFDSQVMIADGCDLQIWDVSNPQAPSHELTVDDFNDVTESVIMAASHVIVNESHCNGAGCRTMLNIFTLGDYPAPVGRFDSPGLTYDVAVNGNIACLADETWGLSVVDISNLSVPTVLGHVDTPGNAVQVALGHGYAYVADGAGGLQIIDLSEPALPALTGALDGNVFGVTVDGSWIYTAAGAEGFQIVDVSDPSMPTVRATIPARGSARRAVVCDSVLYGTDDSGLLVADVSDPLSPVIVDSRADGADALFCTGSKLLVGDDTGLSIYDATFPYSPSFLGFVATPGAVNDIAAENEIAYVTCGRGGMQVIDFSVATDPVLLGGSFLPIDSKAVTVSGSYVFVADEDRYILGCHGGGSSYGLLIYPEQCPVIVGTAPLTLWATSQEEGILVHWESADPELFMSFALERSLLLDGHYEDVLNGDLTVSHGYLDKAVSYGRPYHYRLRLVDRLGNAQVFGPISVRFLPPGKNANKLRLSVLNPFRPFSLAAFHYDLPYSGAVQLSLFDLSGTRVATLVDVLESEGPHSVTWDGRNRQGRQVPAGTYFVRLRFENEERVQRIQVLK